MKHDHFAVRLKTLTRLHCWVGLSLFLLVATASAQARKEDDKEEKAKNLIVMITGQLAGQETIDAGIIFGVTNDRLYIATANHVVHQGMQVVKNLRVFFKFLPGDSIEAKVDKSDPGLDLAVLIIEGLQKQKNSINKLKWNVLADPDTLRRGTSVYFVGGYTRSDPWATPVKPDDIAKPDKLELTFESQFVAQGQSGGGLFNAHWELVGMVKQHEPPYGVATNFNRILKKLKDWGYSVKLTPDKAEKISETTPNPPPPRKKKWWQNPLVIGSGVVVVGAGITAVILWPHGDPIDGGFSLPPGRPPK